MIQTLFDACVQILIWLAGVFGVSYEAVNVWIFCVLWPLFTLALVVTVFHQHHKIKKLETNKRIALLITAITCLALQSLAQEKAEASTQKPAQVLFRILPDSVRVSVVKHEKRHPNYGLWRN